MIEENVTSVGPFHNDKLDGRGERFISNHINQQGFFSDDKFKQEVDPEKDESSQ